MRWLKYAAYLLAVLAVLWTAAWHLVEPVAEWRAEAMFEEMAERGIDAEIGDIEVSGFPTAFDVTLHSVSLRDENRQLALEIPRVEAAYALGSPMQAQVRVSEPIRALRGDDASRVDVLVTLDAFVADVTRQGDGAFAATASAQAVRVDFADAATGRIVNARLAGFSAEATVDEEARRAAARFEAPAATIVDMSDPETPAQIDVTQILSDFAADLSGVRLETTVQQVAVTDAGAPASAPELALAAFAAAPAAVADAAAEVDGGDDGGDRGRSALQELLAEMFGAGGVLTSVSTIDDVVIDRTLPESARPLRGYEMAAPAVKTELTISRDAAQQRMSTGPISLRTTSIAPNGAEFIGLDGSVDGVQMTADAPLTPGDATATVALNAGPLAFTDAALALAFQDGAPALADDQGLRVTAEAALTIADNPLMRALGVSNGANGPALDVTSARLNELRAAVLDFELTADGAFEAGDGDRSGEAAVTLTNWRPFLQRVAALGLFDRALINVMSLSIGAFAQSTEDPNVSTLDLKLQPGEIFVNGRRMAMPGG